MPNYTKRGSSGNKNNSNSQKVDQNSNPMVSKNNNINSKPNGAPPPGFEKNNRRSSAGSWNGNGGLVNGWEHSNGDSNIRRSLGNNFGKYNGYASSRIPQASTTATKFAAPQATFKPSKKANIHINTSESLLQSSASMHVPEMDAEWAKNTRNKFLQSEFTNVMSNITTAKFENGRLVGAFEYIEKEATSSKDLPYMKEFVPLDIEAHKVDLFLKKSDSNYFDSKNNSKESSRSNSRTDNRPATSSSSKMHVNKNKHTDTNTTTYSSSSSSLKTSSSTSKNNRNSKNNRSNNSDNSSSRPRSRN